MKNRNEIKMIVNSVVNECGDSLDNFLDLQLALNDVVYDYENTSDYLLVETIVNETVEIIKNKLLLKLMNTVTSNEKSLDEKYILLSKCENVFGSSEKTDMCYNILFKEVISNETDLLLIKYGSNLETYSDLRIELIDILNKKYDYSNMNIINENLYKVEKEILNSITPLLEDKEIYYLERKELIKMCCVNLFNKDIKSVLKDIIEEFKKEEELIINEDFRVISSLFDNYDNKKKTASYLKTFIYISFDSSNTLENVLFENDLDTLRLEEYVINEDAEMMSIILVGKDINGDDIDFGMFGKNNITRNDINFLNTFLFKGLNYELIQEEVYNVEEEEELVLIDTKIR